MAHLVKILKLLDDFSFFRGHVCGCMTWGGGPRRGQEMKGQKNSVCTCAHESSVHAVVCTIIILV